LSLDGLCSSGIAVWKDADPDIPVLKKPRAEYSKLL
jgi:hypothetical protein